MVMSMRRKPSASPAARWLRGLRPDANPLRRPTDRAEAGLVAIWLISLLCCVPLVALLVGGIAAAVRVPRHAGQPPGYQVPAVLITGATPQLPTGYATAETFAALARWVAPDGAVRSGKVTVSAAATAGRTITIRVTAAGTLVTTPAPPWPSAHVGLVEFFAAAGTALLLSCLYALGRGGLDKRRMAAWDADWRVTGPRWSSRL